MLKTHYNKNTKIWKGLSVLPLYNPNISVGQAILHALTRSPDHIAQVKYCYNIYYCYLFELC